MTLQVNLWTKQTHLEMEFLDVLECKTSIIQLDILPSVFQLDILPSVFQLDILPSVFQLDILPSECAEGVHSVLAVYYHYFDSDGTTIPPWPHSLTQWTCFIIEHNCQSVIRVSA